MRLRFLRREDEERRRTAEEVGTGWNPSREML